MPTLRRNLGRLKRFSDDLISHWNKRPRACLGICTLYVCRLRLAALFQVAREECVGSTYPPCVETEVVWTETACVRSAHTLRRDWRFHVGYGLLFDSKRFSYFLALITRATVCFLFLRVLPNLWLLFFIVFWKNKNIQVHNATIRIKLNNEYIILPSPNEGKYISLFQPQFPLNKQSYKSYKSQINTQNTQSKSLFLRKKLYIWELPILHIQTIVN